MESIFIRAMKYAAVRHKIDRKYSGEPYVIHLQAVYQLLRQVSEDKDVWTAGILHDLIEDTDTTYEDIQREFNTRVANLVLECSKDNQRNYNHLKSKEGYLIKFADTLHNLGNNEDPNYIRKTLFIWKPHDITPEMDYHKEEQKK